MYKTISSLVLASQSPRRQQLLNQMGIEFLCIGADIEEFQLLGEKPVDFVRRMAQSKAFEVASSYPETWILAADTIVVLDDKTLGKPINEAEACDMLGRLSGCWHQVLTAFTLHHHATAKIITMIDSSRVKIASLDSATIASYVSCGEPLDKAGSYAVQGVGGAFVEAIDGSPTNVIGLPLPLVISKLLEYHIIVLQ